MKQRSAHFENGSRRLRQPAWRLAIAAAAAGVALADAATDWKNAPLAELQKAAVAGDAAAQFALGERHWSGSGGAPEQPQLAVEYWTAAARRMHADAIAALGHAVAQGRGAPKHPARAVALWRHAAALGHAGAMKALGQAYAAGEGVAADPAEAARWFQQAAAHGDPQAEYHLGWHYENGAGVEMDLVQAAICYLNAAERGIPAAQNNLGVLYANGDGVPQNLVESYVWLSRAASAGDPKAPANLEAVRRRMSRAEYRQARQRLEAISRSPAAPTAP